MGLAGVWFGIPGNPRGLRKGWPRKSVSRRVALQLCNDYKYQYGGIKGVSYIAALYFFKILLAINSKSHRLGRSCI